MENEKDKIPPPPPPKSAEENKHVEKSKEAEEKICKNIPPFPKR